MAASVGSVIALVICVASTFNYVQGQAAMYAVTVDYGWAQTTGGGYGTTGGGYGSTGMMGTTTVAGEVEPAEAEEMASSPSTTTTTQAPTPKPKKKQRKRPKSRRRRPKNLKPKPKVKAKKPAPTPAPTTRAPTLAPTLAPTTRAPTPAPTTPAPTMAPVKKARKAAKQTHGAQGQQANAGYAAGGGAAQGQQVKVVPHVYQQPVPTTTPAPATKSPLQYLYEPHSCPKMDVATWENEVVIYDNKNCAIIVRMNPRLRRPTVTFQAPYW